MKLIKPIKLNRGDTIGIIAPCYVLDSQCIENACTVLKNKGFNVKFSKNLFANTLGFAATIKERADDFNDMIADENVKMLLFEGGEVCNEILPYIDYENIKRNPKIICSYSDSTSLLTAVHSKTGLVTFYGASLLTFDNLTEYNRNTFENRLMSTSTQYEKAGHWQVIRGGVCEGRLIGGYLINFALMQNGEFCELDKQEKYILLIEDHEKFSSPAAVSKYFSHLEQSGIFNNVTGLIVGHYSMEYNPFITDILKRVACKYKIPVAKNDDFGHGINHAIFPIGTKARLDADNLQFHFLESGVE